MVEWLAPSTAVREVAGSIQAEGSFKRHYLQLELSHVKTWIFSKVQIGKPNTVRRSDYKGVSRVSIKSEHVKNLTIKMVTSMMVIRHRSNNAYIEIVHCE